jgi:hypothetical protein
MHGAAHEYNASMPIYPIIAHPKTAVFRWARSAISCRLSAKTKKNKWLAECCMLTAESSIQKSFISGWTLINSIEIKYYRIMIIN